MQGSIYVLSRKVTGDHGESFMQNVTVFASSPDHARASSPTSSRVFDWCLIRRSTRTRCCRTSASRRSPWTSTR